MEKASGIFDGLKPRQKEAVETTKEDICIIACAGADHIYSQK